MGDIESALYWVDFEYKKEEFRVQVIAHNLKEAQDKASSLVKGSFKSKKAVCVR